MDKVIKIVCSQTTANYRKPTAIDIQESFYLPPYSTVIGMIHKACDFSSYRAMKVSIQGSYASSFTDMYIRYFLDPSFENGRHQFFTTREDGGRGGITRSLGYAETLSDIKLVIHVVCDDEKDTESVIDGLKNPKTYLSLGRHEDLLCIESVELVDVIQVNEVKLAMDTYVPMDIYKRSIKSEEPDNEGVILNLNKVFDRTSGYRVWEKKRVKYLTSGGHFSADSNEFLREKDSEIGIYLA
ncbi:MAG: CRISPR-associated protein Cas5 [Clostridia bacterium]